MTILLQAQSSPAIMQVLLFGGMFLVMYLFMIRPQQKKQKEHKAFLEGLKKGDNVTTIGGIHGKVSSVNDTTVTLEIDSKGNKIVFDKTAVSKAVEVAA